MHSREAPGDPGAGPSGRTCQAAAHTVPHCGIRAEPTHRPGAVGTAVPRQRGKERTGVSAATFPHASLVRRVGVRADGQRPRGSCNPLSHP